MSEASTPDLGRIINLIMENPKLIEEISNLAKGESQPKEAPKEASPTVAPQERAEVAASAVPARSQRGRSELLTLLKPYLSERRASAIDSMVSIADVLKIMKRGG